MPTTYHAVDTAALQAGCFYVKSTYTDHVGAIRFENGELVGDADAIPEGLQEFSAMDIGEAVNVSIKDLVRVTLTQEERAYIIAAVTTDLDQCDDDSNNVDDNETHIGKLKLARLLRKLL